MSREGRFRLAITSLALLHLRVFLARMTRVVRIPLSALRMILRLLIVDDSAVRLLITLGARSAW